VKSVGKSGSFVVFAEKDEYHARALVVATGGLSIPKMGASSFGYDLAQQFGLKIVETRTALVSLVFKEEDGKRFCDLSGVSAEVVASIGKQRFREKMLFTHRGISGPAILQISSYWKPQVAVSLDLAPDRELTAASRDGKRDISSLRMCLREFLPHRFADRWL